MSVNPAFRFMFRLTFIFKSFTCTSSGSEPCTIYRHLSTIRSRGFNIVGNIERILCNVLFQIANLGISPLAIFHKVLLQTESNALSKLEQNNVRPTLFTSAEITAALLFVSLKPSADGTTSTKTLEEDNSSWANVIASMTFVEIFVFFF